MTEQDLTRDDVRSDFDRLVAEAYAKYERASGIRQARVDAVIRKLEAAGLAAPATVVTAAGMSETVPTTPPQPPPRVPRRIIEACLYHILTEPGGGSWVTGLDSPACASRRGLARAIAARLFGTDRPEWSDARAFWPVVADVIGSLLRRWAESQLDGPPAPDRPSVELAGRPVLLPPMADPVAWAAAAAGLATCRDADPVAADVFDLCVFAGLGAEDVALLTGLTAKQVARTRAALAGLLPGSDPGTDPT